MCQVACVTLREGFPRFGFFILSTLLCAVYVVIPLLWVNRIWWKFNIKGKKPCIFQIWCKNRCMTPLTETTFKERNRNGIRDCLKQDKPGAPALKINNIILKCFSGPADLHCCQRSVVELCKELCVLCGWRGNFTKFFSKSVVTRCFQYLECSEMWIAFRLAEMKTANVRKHSWIDVLTPPADTKAGGTLVAVNRRKEQVCLVVSVSTTGGSCSSYRL